MIKVKEGSVHIEGSTTDIMLDLIEVIKGLREMFTENYNEEIADRIISDCGKLAYIDKNDTDAFEEILKNSPLRKETASDNKAE